MFYKPKFERCCKRFEVTDSSWTEKFVVVAAFLNILHIDIGVIVEVSKQLNNSSCGWRTVHNFEPILRSYNHMKN